MISPLKKCLTVNSFGYFVIRSLEKGFIPNPTDISYPTDVSWKGGGEEW